MRLTLKRIETDIDEAGQRLRHDPKGLQYACQKMNKYYSSNGTKISTYKLFRLLCFNEAIRELNTHSYGFHTANGRWLIESMEHYYYEHQNGNTYE